MLVIEHGIVYAKQALSLALDYFFKSVLLCTTVGCPRTCDSSLASASLKLGLQMLGCCAQPLRYFLNEGWNPFYATHRDSSGAGRQSCLLSVER